MTHCMIDLETHDTIATARILSIGAVMFNPRDTPGTPHGEEFYAVLDLTSQEERTTSQATLDWWKKQGPAAYAALEREEPRPIGGVLSEFKAWWSKCGAIYPWSNGATFDIPMLEHAYRHAEQNKGAPWKYSKSRDTRTLFWLADKYRMPRGGNDHDALRDAKRQAWAVQKCMETLRGGPVEFKVG